MVQIDLDSTWDIENKIVEDVNSTWAAGDTPLYYFRIEGECLQPNCSNASLQPNDSCGAGKSRFMQIVAARTVNEACKKLKEKNLVYPSSWPIHSIKRYSRPVYMTDVLADEANGINHDCNELIDEPFCQAPECMEFAAGVPHDVSMGMKTEYIPAFVYEGSGGVFITGDAIYAPPLYLVPPTLKLLNVPSAVEGAFNMAYSLAFNGSARFVTKMGMDVSVLDFTWEHIVEETEVVPTLQTDTSSVNMLCTCQTIPLVMRLQHNLVNGNNLYDFLRRNNYSLPSEVEMRYNKPDGVWRYSTNYIGDGDLSTQERWKLLFEWGCSTATQPVLDPIESIEALDGFNDDFSTQFEGVHLVYSHVQEEVPPTWKFSLWVQRLNLTTGTKFDTRLLYSWFAETKQCEPLNFQFFLNTQSGVVTMQMSSLVSDQSVFQDDIGLFKNSTWTNNPNLRILVPQVEASATVKKIDISPIFPSP